VFDAIVAGSHLRYDGPWQRPQQILSRLAQRARVFVLEEPLRSEADRDEVRQFDAVTVVRPLRRGLGRDADERSIATVRALCGGHNPLVWLYTPMMLALADAFPGAPLVYDCMDELAAFDFAPPELRGREAALLRRADLVFAGGRTLYEGRRALGERVRLYPSGVDFAHFARAGAIAPHPLVRELTGPVFGYVGVIDERIDREVLLALGDAGAQSVIVGPFAKIDPATLPRSPRLHYTGIVPYDDLPSFLAGFDVAIMPFARNVATASISPTKTLEYLAAGKPVVSTPIADVVAEYGDVVSFAEEPSAFVAACMRALQPDERRRTRGIELARAGGWDDIVARMWADLVATNPDP